MGRIRKAHFKGVMPNPPKSALNPGPTSSDSQPTGTLAHPYLPRRGQSLAHRVDEAPRHRRIVRPACLHEGSPLGLRQRAAVVGVDLEDQVVRQLELVVFVQAGPQEVDQLV